VPGTGRLRGPVGRRDRVTPTALVDKLTAVG